LISQANILIIIIPYDLLSRECERTYNDGNVTKKYAEKTKAFAKQYKHHSIHLDILDPRVMNEDIFDI